MNNIFKTTVLILTAICFLLPSIASSSTLYKWKDEKGSWHFSNTPPQQKETVKDLNISKLTAAPVTEYAPSNSNYNKHRTQQYIAQQKLKHDLKHINKKYKREIRKINKKYDKRRKERYDERISKYKTKARTSTNNSTRKMYNQWAKEESDKLWELKKKRH